MIQHATAPITAAILTTHERVEIPELGIEVLIPAAFVRKLKRDRKPLDIHFEFDAEPADLPLLSAEQVAVIDYLKENGVTSAADLAHHIGFSSRTLSNWCGPGGPLRAHGVNSTTKGYGVG